MRLSKPKSRRNFLASRAWAILRARHLRRRPNCAWCGARGPKGMTVDHVEPRARRPDLAMDPANLQTLCSQCHGQAKQHHERADGDVLAGGSSSNGWPVDPGHPWNLPRGAAPGARLAPKRPAVEATYGPAAELLLRPKKPP